MKSCYTCQAQLDCDCCFPPLLHDINSAVQQAVIDSDFEDRVSVLATLQQLGDAIGETCRDYRKLTPATAAGKE